MKRAWLLLGLISACAPPGATQKTIDEARAIAAEVDEARVFADVEALAKLHANDSKVNCAALNASSDTWCNLSNVQARAFIARRFASLGLTSRDDPSERHPSTDNLFVELPGTSKPDEVILLGAHFDAFFMGADDNSSGVAVMLEVARLLASRPRSRTIRFVGFDLEEIGLVGSARHVSSQKVPTASLVLDCVGYADSTPGSQQSLPGFPVPPAGDFIAGIANDVSRSRLEEAMTVVKGQQAPPIQAIVAPGLGAGPLSGNLMRSDHAPFWLAGHSAVFFTDTANFRNPHYHTRQDTPEIINKAFLAGVARATAMTVISWSETP